MLLEIETAITERLDEHIQGWKVSPFPDDPEELGAPTLSKQIFVGFRRESLDVPNLIGQNSPITQSRTIEYEILIKAKDLRTHQGIYPLIDQIRDLLTGFKPIAHSRMYQTGSQFVDAKNGIWLFGMTFATRIPYQKRT